MRIEPGSKSQIGWGDGHWIFLDIGFANQARTCGLLFGDATPEVVQFGEATCQIVSRIKNWKQTNLVIEAPLSVCFDLKGNPKGRLIEQREGDKTSRYWYIGPGCVVMVAAMYLVRLIFDAESDGRVHLFEGFVSFKDRSVRSDHKQDVCALRKVVRDPAEFSDSIYSPEQLNDSNDSLYSAFRVAGLDCGVPVVIKAIPEGD